METTEALQVGINEIVENYKAHRIHHDAYKIMLVGVKMLFVGMLYEGDLNDEDTECLKKYISQIEDLIESGKK